MEEAHVVGIAMLGEGRAGRARRALLEKVPRRFAINLRGKGFGG